MKTNYKESNGCWNCKFVYTLDLLDESPEYFCNIDSDRPWNEDEILERFQGFLTTKEKAKVVELQETWFNWAYDNKNDHEVKAYGSCDDHERILEA